MPTFYFDVRDGEGVHRDDTGIELSDMDSAVAEARRALVDMSRETLAKGAADQLEILVRDSGDGPVKLVLSLRTEDLSESERGQTR